MGVVPLTTAAGQRWQLAGRRGGDPVSAPATVPGDVTHDMLAAGELGVDNRLNFT